MMGLSRYRNSPSCFWDREIRRRRDRDVFINKILQRNKAECSDVTPKPLLLRALNFQKSTAERGTTMVADCREIIDMQHARAENAALLVKVQRLKDKNKQERSSCFSEYKRETASKFLRLVKDRDTCNLQLADVQKSNGHLEDEIALLREQKVDASTQAENAALEVESLREKIRYITKQQNIANLGFVRYKTETSSRIQKLEREQYHAVADPGFSPGGGANSQKCYYFSIFCRKLHENERIWTPRGGARPWRPPLDPPMLCYC